MIYGQELINTWESDQYRWRKGGNTKSNLYGVAYMHGEALFVKLEDEGAIEKVTERLTSLAVCFSTYSLYPSN